MATEVKKLQFSEGTDVGAPTDLSLLTSTTTITAYANDAAYVSANGTATEGDVYLNTTTEKFRMYLGGAWRNAVPESDPTDSTKLFLVDVSGNTTGMSVTLSFAATASRNIQFPDTDMIVASRSGNEILSTKTLASPLISGGSVDVVSAGNLAIGASIGANNLTLGGATTNLIVPGNLEVQGTTTTLNTATLDVEDTNITINNGGNDASSEGAGLTVERTGTSGSLKYEDALASKWKAGALGSEKEVITTDTIQSLENKRVKLQTTVAANDTTSPRLVLPSNTYANLLAISAGNHLAEGAVYWATDLNKAYIWDGSSLVEVGSGAGSGSGSKNYLQDWFDAEALLGTLDTLTDTGNRTTGTDRWGKTATGALAEDTTNELRGAQSYKFTPTGSAEFIETPMFSLETIDLGKPMYISLDLNNAGVDGDFDIVALRYNSSGTYQEKISVAGNASSGTPASAKLPLSITTFKGFFLPSSTSGDQYSLRIRRLTAGTTAVIFDSILVGPQIQFVGSAVSDWQSYTPTNTQGFGTISAVNLEWRRSGDSIDVRGYFTAGTVTGSEAQIELPNSYKIGGAGTSTVVVGKLERDVSTSHNDHAVLVTKDDTFLNFGQVGISAVNPMTPAVGTDFLASSQRVSFFANNIPISGFSSNVTMADRAVEEYASNDGSGGTSAGATYSTGMTKGKPTGEAFVAVNSTTANSITTYLVEFNSPIQSTDYIELRVFENGKNSVDALNIGRLFQGTSNYGIWYNFTSNPNQIYVNFGNKGRASSNATYAGDGATWASIAGGAYTWTAVKISGGALVGYPVGSRNIVGDTTGTAVPTGYLGREISSNVLAGSAVTLTTAQYSDVTSIILTPGVWDLSALVLTTGGAITGTGWVAGISTTSGNSGTGLDNGINRAESPTLSSAGADNSLSIPQYRVLVTSNTTYYLKALASFTVGTAKAYGRISAVMK